MREEAEGTQALVAAARALRARGYARIVAAGQSAGGWLALRASATTRGVLDAVVATAPAVHGKLADDAARATRARAEFLRIAEHVDRVPTMVFLFAGDDFDPGGRGLPLAQALARRGVPHVVVDAPAGWRGHGAGQSRAFARRFGNCIVAFVAPREPPASPSCDAAPAAEIPFEFLLPPDWTPPRAANDDAPGAAWIGAWRGSLDNGDDVMLAVERVDGATITALFARGRSRPGAADRPFTQLRAGALVGAGRVARFPVARDRPGIVATRDGDTVMVEVEDLGGRRRFAGTLRRLR